MSCVAGNYNVSFRLVRSYLSQPVGVLGSLLSLTAHTQLIWNGTNLEKSRRSPYLAAIQRLNPRNEHIRTLRRSYRRGGYLLDSRSIIVVLRLPKYQA